MSRKQVLEILTEAQTDIVLRNWWRLLGIKRVTCCFDGKPKFSRYMMDTYRLIKFTRFAKRYTLFKCEGNPNGVLFFLIVNSAHFDSIEYRICSWFIHIIEPYIVPNNYTRPQIFICARSELNEVHYNKLPMDIFRYPHRFCSLYNLYNVLGSASGLYGYTYDYKILHNVPLEYNKYDYAGIPIYDPMTVALNGIIGDVIEYKRILNECSPYEELCRRRVVDNQNIAHGFRIGLIDRDVYRDYEIDCDYHIIEHPKYKGPIINGQTEWIIKPPIITKEEYKLLTKNKKTIRHRLEDSDEENIKEDAKEDAKEDEDVDNEVNEKDDEEVIEYASYDGSDEGVYSDGEDDEEGGEE